MELVNLEMEIKLKLKLGRYITSVRTRNSEMCTFPKYLAISCSPLGRLTVMGEIYLHSLYKSREDAMWSIASKSRSQVLRSKSLFMVQTIGKTLPISESILRIVPSWLIYAICVEEEDPMVDVCCSKLIRAWYCYDVNFISEFCLSWIVVVVVVEFSLFVGFVVVLLILAPGTLCKRCPGGYPCFLKHSVSLWPVIPQ